MLTRRLYIIDNYDSFTHNLFQIVATQGALQGLEVFVVRNDKAAVSELSGAAGIIISPGPGTPDDAGISKDVVSRYSESMPILGVCLGHQVIAEYFGAAVKRAKYPTHGKATQIRHSQDGIFAGIRSPMKVGRYHSLIVDPDTVSEPLTVTATSQENEIMALGHRILPIFGVQFHPESFLTEFGGNIIQNFLGLIK